MKRPVHWFLLALPILAICLIIGCGCDQPRNTQSVSSTATPAPASTPEPVRQWPFTEGEPAGNIAVSQKLLAKNYLLVYDGSGSMNEETCAEGSVKYLVARDAVKEWIKTVPEEANIGMVAFFQGQWMAQNIGADRQQLMETIDRINPGGKTPLGLAFSKAYKMLTEQALNQLGYGTYTLVTITDGAATDMPELNRQVHKIVDKSFISIYTIGFCIPGGKHSLNQPGKTIYRSANKPDELRQGLQEVLAESETFDVSVFN